MGPLSTLAGGPQKKKIPQSGPPTGFEHHDTKFFFLIHAGRFLERTVPHEIGGTFHMSVKLEKN